MSTTPPPAVPLSHGARFAVLGAVLLALFLSSLDQTVVGTALPVIVTDLQGGELYTWVITAYLLTSTVTIPIYGELSDIYGRKPVLSFGIIVFMIGSLLSALSETMVELILARGLQGIGAGAIAPVSLAIVGDLFSPAERARYQGLFSSVLGISLIVGPFLGGWITDAISWHWVFLVNLPVSLLTLVIILAVFPHVRRSAGTRLRDLDLAGMVLFTLAVVPIMLGVTNKGNPDAAGRLPEWTDPGVGGLILVGLVILAVFLWREARAANPIIPLDLFRNRTFALTNAAAFIVSLGLFVAIVFLPRYFQAVRGASPTESGYLIWPLLLGLVAGSILSGYLISYFGRYKVFLVGAMVLLVVGSVLSTRIEAQTPNPILWFWLALLGLGQGPTLSAFTVIVQNSVSLPRIGVATSTLTFNRQIGGSIGLAVAGSIFSGAFAQNLGSALQARNVPSPVVQQLAGDPETAERLAGVDVAAVLPSLLPPGAAAQTPAILAAAAETFATALGNVFWLSAGTALIALLLALALPNLRLKGPPAPGDQAGTSSRQSPSA